MLNRKIEEHDPDQNRKIHYTYDHRDRCIQVEEELGELHFFSQTLFDRSGNQIASIDRFGHRIDYRYDSFGRVTEATYPLVLDEEGKAERPTYHYAYDLFGNCVEVTDPKGFVTKKRYNVRGQPIHIEYPDGSVERYKYDLEGSLHRQVTRDQIIHVFEYDFLGRPTIETQYASTSTGRGGKICSTANKYDAFHLLQSIDERGFATLYHYDASGRLNQKICPTKKEVQQEEKESRKEEFSYDQLGRLAGIKTWYGEEAAEYVSIFREHDPLGQLIEERGEDSQGRICWKKGYAYDRSGALTQTLSYIQEQPLVESEISFDPLGNPTSFKEASGRSYTIQQEYTYCNALGQQVLKKRLLDPSQTQTEMIYDAMGRLSTLRQIDKEGRELLQREILYDLNGNKSVEVTKSGADSYRVEWSYGPLNRLETLREGAGTAEERVTHFSYTEQGQLASILSPGASSPLCYSYNSAGRLASLCQSNKQWSAFSNEYTYDEKGNATTGKAQGQVTVHRKYDAFDQIIEESWTEGGRFYSLRYTYDKMGRRVQMELPDGSTVCYTYDGFFPHSISVPSSQGRLIYTHTYQSYDLSGHLTQETLFGAGGERSSLYTLDGTKEAIQSDLLCDRILKWGLSGEILQRETLLNEELRERIFSYDGWGHLTKEPEHTYTYDGLRNRTSKDGQAYSLNPLHQLLSDGKEEHRYDPQGYLVAKGEQEFTYDPLGRLLSIRKGDKEVTYTYDPFGRRINRKEHTYQGKKKKCTDTTHFFYFGEEEIGSLSKNECVECKILGAFDEPLAMTIRGDLLLLLCDLEGNVIALVDPYDAGLEGITQWTVFGERTLEQGRQSPWGYQGKREDPFTQLISFGQREYDPTTGRWTTPDPAGNIDGPNPYQYTWNNPLTFHDRWGLSSTTLSSEEYIYGEVEPVCPCVRHRDCKRGGDFRNLNPAHYPSAPCYVSDPSLKISSKIYDLSEFELPELPKGQIGFINGTFNTYEEAIGHALYLSRLTGGFNIHAVYNANQSGVKDIKACSKELSKFAAPPAVCKLQEIWNAFFHQAGKNELYLQFCHSEGAILVRNALLDYPDHLREKIIVVAIAPGAYIPREICARPIHYVSTRDVVPRFDRKGRKLCKNTTVILKPHKKAPWFDHSFQSETYKEAIQYEYNEYVKQAQKW